MGLFYLGKSVINVNIENRYGVLLAEQVGDFDDIRSLFGLTDFKDQLICLIQTVNRMIEVIKAKL